MKKYLVSLFSFLFLILFASNVYASITPIITLSDTSLVAGETATVTFTFTENPLSFTADDVTASKGIISDFTVTGDPLVYIATFTPTSEIIDASNVITIASKDTIKKFTGLPSYSRTDLAFDGTNMWVTSYVAENSVSKVAPDGTVTTYTGTGSWPKGIEFDGVNMWTANYLSHNVSKITPSGTITNFSVAGNPDGIAFDGTNMWTANYTGHSASKIEPNGSVTTYSGQAGSYPWDIAFDGTNMWTVNYYGGTVTKFTPEGVATTYSGIGDWATGIAFDGTNMWTVSNYENQVAKIDPSGNVTTYSTGGGLGAGGYGLVFANDYIWVADNVSSRLIKMNTSGVIEKTYSLGVSPYNVISVDSEIWMTYSSGGIARLGSSTSANSENYEINTRTYTSSSSSSSTHYGCKDESAINYEYFAASDPSLCKYGENPIVVATSSPSVSMNSKELILTVTSVFENNISKIKNILKFGSNNSEVEMLQQFLIDKNIGPASASLKDHGTTYEFGPLTKSALAEWQKASDLKADGILGPLTKAKMLGSL
ncbi:MAG: Ig-like domain-containing protein [Candidatus Paceibacterota bacterium]